jgi:hypothetical protein
MEADYSIDLGPDSAALEVPWHDPEGRWHYVPLRGSPRGDNAAQCDRIPLDWIPEAQRFAALRRFLEQANSPQSAWESVKCGVWAAAAAAGGNPYGAPCEHGCYVDVVLALASPADTRPQGACAGASCAELRDNLPAHEQWARQMAKMLEEDAECQQAAAEIVVRRCYFHRAGEPEESDAGYCLSLFVFGYGPDADSALTRWERALEAAASCLLRVHPAASAR